MCREYSIPGFYRKIIEKPKDLTWRIVRYDNYEVPLVLSDISAIQNKEAPASNPGMDLFHIYRFCYSISLPYVSWILLDGKHKALVASFNLSSSCYATMCLRELMKVSQIESLIVGTYKHLLLGLIIGSLSYLQIVTVARLYFVFVFVSVQTNK